MPNLLPDWHFFRPAGRLIWFSLMLIVLMIPVIVALRRPKSEKETTWAQAMLGSVYIFWLFLLAYAIIPHEFITFADKYLLWGHDKYVVKSTTAIPGISAFNWPVSIDMQAVRDIAVVGIYGVFSEVNIFLLVKGQDGRVNPPEDEDAEPVVAGGPRFGPPLRAKV